jgi:RNA polymerase sigma-70 factor, ECF subfamily
MVNDAFIQKKAWPLTMAEPDENLQLVRRIAAGEDPALHELYSRYGQRLYAYARRLCNDPAQAEDVVQETLVVVWRTANRYRGEGRLIAWLLGIVHHISLKSMRHPFVPIPAEAEETLVAPGASPEQLTQASQQADWVRGGLESLSPEQRAVLELVFYQGLSLEETARVCGCPLGTVKSRLSYARQHLRGVLSRQKMEDWQ